MTRSTKFRMWLVCGLVYAAAVACATFVPQNGWDPSFGPVVPHDTFPGDCSLCHESGGWHTLRADHEKETGVALVGAHGKVGCLMCHNDRGPVAQFAARGCAGCHADPHLQRLGNNCKDCHDETSWRAREAIAQHDRTRFPLIGAHAAVACFRCHPGAQVGNFAGAPVECGQCHADDRTRTTDPDHVALGYSLDCQQCHLSLGWKPARFDHPASFPLTNGHFGRQCRECHTSPNSFTGLSPACATCHTDEHAVTVEPSHPAAGFGTDCSECHDTRTFRVSSWPHPSSFPLTFGHAGQRCTRCHQNQVYSGTSATCSTCHLPDYQGTTNPNHVMSGFSTDCTLCHGTAGWHGAVAEHPASFPLTNSHARACNDCHTTPGTYAGLSTACVSCHLTQYQATTSPNHVGIGYSTDCALCHGTVTWQGATGTHPATFPLTNAHNRACTACHTTPGTYAGLNTACVSCHLTEYQGTTDPSHTAFMMSQQCQDCHGTTTWRPSSFVHQFPINSGAHRNLACFDCHNNPGNRAQFSCIDCHEHRQSEMNSKHNEVGGYTYNSAACYSCHPNGRH